MLAGLLRGRLVSVAAGRLLTPAHIRAIEPTALQTILAPNAVSWRGGSYRKRRRKLLRALEDPETHPGTLKKLRERAARPSHDLLRYIAENKTHKPVKFHDRRQLWFDISYRKYAPMFLGQFLPRMQFWTAAVDAVDLPPPRLPEVALAGRSNSGKSTFINYLCGRHSAKVRRYPGSTLELVFWRIGKPAQLCLVDLPGYGYAMQPQERRMQWTELMLWYLRSRRNLRLVLLLIDGRQGLKASDKEFIAYLERHNVNWRAVVTKADKVLDQDLARRITVMKEEMQDYHRMTGDPIPVSALKMRGMDAVRKVLSKYKAQKEIVKDGIKKRVFDLLEQRRMLRAERGRRRREKKRLAEEEAAAAKEAAEAAGEDAEASDNTSKKRTPSLHDLIGTHSLPWLQEDQSTLEQVNAVEATASKTRHEVAQMHYGLDDRDSRRVNALMQGLFPDMPASVGDPPLVSASAHGGDMEADPRSWLGLAHLDGADSQESGSDSEQESRPVLPTVVHFHPQPAGWQLGDSHEMYANTDTPDGSAFPTFPPRAGKDDESQAQQSSQAGGWHGGSLHSAAYGWTDRDTEEEELDSDSDSDDDLDTSAVTPNVTHFHPQPVGPASLRMSRASQQQSETGNSSSAFPTLSHLSQTGDGGGRQQDSKASLRSWIRPTAKYDQVYSEDDIVMPDEHQAAWRASTPPPPSTTEPGKMLKEARQRYEREWAMELQNIDPQRKSAADETGPKRSEPSVSRSSAASTAQVTSFAPRSFEMVKKSKRRLWFITKTGLREVPKGRTKKYRVIGKPPARILKKKKDPDIAKEFFQSDKTRRKSNVGSGLSYQEAREHWIGWAQRNKRNGRVLEATSPARADVNAAWERQEAKRNRRSVKKPTHGFSRRPLPQSTMNKDE